MAKRRVFEIARELGITSKVILEKCRAEGLEVKNHMSAISAGLEETIAEWFSDESGAHTAVETTEHVDLDKARAEARKQRRRRTRKKAELAAEEEAKSAAEATDSGAEVDASAAAAVAEAPGEAAEEEAAPAEEETAVAEPVAEAREAEAPVVEEAEEAAEEEPEEPVRPAGPQVVPKPAVLQGPRVVRVERPEAVESPRRRRGPSRLEPTAPQVVDLKKARKKEEEEEKEGQGKKGKKRSPRRRGGRSADSGEPVREWRNADLAERSQRLAAAGGGLRRHRANVSRAGGVAGPQFKVGPVDIAEPITIKSLSEATGVKSAEFLKKLMELGVMGTINQVISTDMAETIVSDYDIELVVRAAKSAENDLVQKFEAREVGELTPRAPVVTFLGHVDHGKTSLLDRIRDTAVAEGEAGGITQHIGAYRYDKGNQHVVFLDTPGHEAFSAMRARGANMTDVVVLVVAADDGVMPQTVEAINHAKAAGVPILVALNKIDLPNANLQRVMGQLAEQGVTVQPWGGEVEMIETSATTGQGIELLIETLSLEAEILELKAEADAPAAGFVIESQLDPGRGAVARLLVRSGTLRVGDVLLAGSGYGRVRSVVDSLGRSIDQAGPSTPVEVAGLGEVPEAGDKFYVAESIEQARSAAAERKSRARTKSLAGGAPLTLENLFSRIEDGQINAVPLIVKADVQGSVEALVGSLEKLSTDEVKVNILHTAVGGISAGDVTLAEASNAIIVGFNVVPDSTARALAKEKGIDIRLYRVIYDIIDDIRSVMSEGLAPEIREESLGRVEVRRIFRISRLGTIAGCYITEGRAVRNAKVRLIRDNIVVEDERTIESLRHEKNDVREARAGTECGVKLAGYDDIKEGDVLEFYQHTEVARTL